jgi:hypothetical protein
MQDYIQIIKNLREKRKQERKLKQNSRNCEHRITIFNDIGGGIRDPLIFLKHFIVDNKFEYRTVSTHITIQGPTLSSSDLRELARFCFERAQYKDKQIVEATEKYKQEYPELYYGWKD